MSISVTCVQCGTSHRVNDAMAGRRVRCPSCDTVVHVPEADVTGSDSPITPSEQGRTDGASGNPETDSRAALASGRAGGQTAGLQGTSAAMRIPVPAGVDSPVSDTLAATEPNRSAVVDDEDDEDEVLARTRTPEQEMDMTPMVDVTFLLLIFFMVTAAFSLQKSIEVPRQQTDLPSTSVVDDEQEELDTVEVEIDEMGSFLVMAPDWERETPGKQNLLTALREAISGHSTGMKLSIKVHEMAKLHALVDAMDAGTIAGYTEVEVTQVEEFN